MPFAIQLFFDQKTETVIQAVWQKLADQGIADYMHKSGNRPHISLAIFETIELESGRSYLTSLAEQIVSFEITFSHLGVFTTPKAVVFIAPTINSPLLSLHSKIHLTFGPTGSSPWDHYLPNHWVPHCTLGMDLASDTITSTVEVAQHLELPLQAKVTDLGIIEFRPVRHLFSASLGNNQR